jgi:dipeptidase E
VFARGALRRKNPNMIMQGGRVMGTNILTSGFPAGFTSDFSNALIKTIRKREKFVFIASDFKNDYEKTDKYYRQFLQEFSDCGIVFEQSVVVDARVTPDDAKKAVSGADVLWLSGGNTYAQMGYIKSYGLIASVLERDGVTIGMSAGSINMAKTAICVPYRDHPDVEVYEGIGLVDISVEPHFGNRSFLNEMMYITNDYPLYGLCDNSFIIIEDNKMSCTGDVFFIQDEISQQISYAHS